MADRPRSGCPSRSTNDVRRIETLFVSNPRVSIRDAERGLNILRSIIQRILRATLRMFPYRIPFLQQLLPNDYQKGLESAQHCQLKWEWCGINEQNCVFWWVPFSHQRRSEKAQFESLGNRESSHGARSSVKVWKGYGLEWNVWIKDNGPLLFPWTIGDWVKYNRMLRYYAIPKIQELPGSPTFRHDSTLAHYSISVR